MTETGRAHWRCGDCIQEWTWGSQGPTRVFAIGGNGGDYSGDVDFNGYRYAYVGIIPQALENRITFCQGLRLDEAVQRTHR